VTPRVDVVVAFNFAEFVASAAVATTNATTSTT
jgi:hypothetical protein